MAWTNRTSSEAWKSIIN